MDIEVARSSLGRGVIVAAGAEVPEPWRHTPRLRVDAATLAAPAPAIAELHAAWSQRAPIVVELAVERAALLAPETDAREPYELAPDFDFPRERLYFLIRANNYDARAGDPRWWPEVEAERLGATVGGPADVLLADGTPAWLDGGPRGTAVVPAGHVVVHRSHLDLGSLTPDRPASAPAAGLAPDQLRAVEHAGGPARIIAPAGSGKTRVLTERLRALVTGRGWDPRQVVALAYNVRAREEMVQRTADVAGAAQSIRTLNAFALKIVGRARPGVAVVEERDVRQRLEALVRVKPRRDTDALAPYLDALTEVRLGLRTPADVEDDRGDVDGLAEIFPAFVERMTRDGVVDFDGMIYEAIRLLLTDPARRAEVRRLTRHFLVDELQDLTPAHVLLVRLLAAPAFDVFGVGDDDQVIYGYNGADPDFLVRYGHYFPGAAEHALEVNYRCPAPVVAAAATLLTHNRRRVAKAIHAARTDGTLTVAEVAGSALATTALDGVRGWLAAGVPAGEVAVLTRVNASLLALQVLLADHGVATNRPLSERVLERTGTRTALAYLRVAAALADGAPMTGGDVALCAARPYRKIPRPVRDQLARRRSWTPESLARFADGAATGGASTAAVDGLARLVTDLTTVARLARRAPTAEVLVHVRELVAEGLRALDRSSRGPDASHLDDLDALIAVAAAQPDVHRFEPWLREHLRVGPPDPAASGDAVTLASVHKVKGMEWDRVVVLGAHDGLMPHRLAEDVEEERRVFHVAITRSRVETLVVADESAPRRFLRQCAEPRSDDAPMPIEAAAPRAPARRGRTLEARVGLRVTFEGTEGEITDVRADAAVLTADGGYRLTIAYGEAVEVDGRRLALAVPAATAGAAAAELDAAGQARFTQLKAWRLERARGDGVPAFVVLNDRHLTEVARRAPASLDELAACPGIGPAKLDRYGEEIVALLEASAPAPM